MITDFTSSIIYAFDTHVPIVKKLITEYPLKMCPSKETLEIKAKRDTAYKISHHFPSTENLKTFHDLNLKVRRLIPKDS